MAQVYVRNDNVHPYSEKYKGRVIQIPAGESIQMDADDAKRFLAQCNGVKVDADGQPDPRGFKRLRIEAMTKQAEAEKPATVFVSHIDGKEFPTKKALEAHLEQFKDRVVKDENAEREMAQRPVGRGKSKSGAA
jgi:hypothetical protein